ncbi:hypothetical protein FNO01nite_33800 [Flavobacterium noncentrifugens]|uniref:Lipoprotein n=1 Tax=Flavobacterium noncentrifugens TaxID=1128970 RepID=A0A1G9DM36_9FLAO|nr:hypothetical protein [Flavobacterium noncentrifugens]GEP52708.1 hypothetical protein FNO01nite_33800 [Flavobacterium noncentrifugens]SDK64631.1 hypothetical protein SAMN04487935_3845 [Flavobacterium noncentrifugens]SDK64956.1 hypothetical protein SAMN04487935_3851 [Flavobacterium noncentrifugens]
MNKFILLITSVILFSCKGNSEKEFENFSLSISNQNFNYNLESGVFQIPAINFVDTIKLNKVEKNKISKSFYKYQIDTLNGEKLILPKKPIIMPDFRDLIIVKIKNIEKSKLIISNQIETKSDLNNIENGICKFNEDLIEILSKNPDFKDCMNILKSNYKNIPPSM